MDENIYDVNVNKTAKNDIRGIIKFISKNNPINALNVLKKIQDRIDSLYKFPERGGYVQEFLKYNIKDYRQLMESPWRIIYRIDGNIVNVIMVIDSRRNTQDILIEKLLEINEIRPNVV